jgi:hypothetical protein
VGDNVNVTLSVNFTNPSRVFLTTFYDDMGFSGSDLFASTCNLRTLSFYKCGSTNTSTSITVTIYMTNVALYSGGVYSLTSDAGAGNWDSVTLTVCGEYNRLKKYVKQQDYHSSECGKCHLHM